MRATRLAAITIGIGPVLALSCVGTTGGALVTFPVAASGLADAEPGQPFEFLSDTLNDGEWHVVLAKAVLHIGAVYLSQSKPVSGAQGTNCVLDPNSYVAQVTPALNPQAGLDVDLLSPSPQRFSVQGQGITIPPALIGQVWLTGGSIDTVTDSTPILTIAGVADDGHGRTIPFSGVVTIGTNRQGMGGLTAGTDTICTKRIVSIPLDLSVQTQGGLILRIDPRRLFDGVDFGLLPMGAEAGTYAFSDEPDSAAYTQPSAKLYDNLHSKIGLYNFSWIPDL